jgi:hypothetical protein
LLFATSFCLFIPFLIIIRIIWIRFIYFRLLRQSEHWIPILGPHPGSRLRNAELLADLAGKDIRDLRVPGNRNPPSVGGILEDGMASTFSEQAAATLEEMAEQVSSLQAALT